MAFDAHKNFAYSTVATAPSPALSGTSLVVSTGEGSKFPTPPFNATIWPVSTQPTAANSEVVRVTAISTDTLTIVRAQESSSARTVIVGDQIAATITSKVITDIESYINPTGTINAYGARVAPANWLLCDGSAVSRTTYANLFAAIIPSLGTFTVTIATPGVVSLTAHGLSTGDAIFLTTTGALPTGLLANTLYYVIRVDANSFNLATSRANAYVATKIATSGTQSGTHTAWDCPYGLGDGSTTFTLPDLRGRSPAGQDTTSGTAAGRLNGADPTNGSYGNIGATGGEQTHAMTDLEAIGVGVWHSDVMTGITDNVTTLFNVGTVNGIRRSNTARTGHNVVQPVQVVNYIIKT